MLGGRQILSGINLLEKRVMSFVSDGVLDLNGSGVHLFSKLLNVTGTEMAAEFLTELRFPNRTGVGERASRQFRITSMLTIVEV